VSQRAGVIPSNGLRSPLRGSIVVPENGDWRGIQARHAKKSGSLSAASITSESVQWPLTILPKELHWVDIERRRQLFEHVDGGRVLLALKESRIVSVKARTIRQVLLRDSLLTP
jgi:hypothetical protein